MRYTRYTRELLEPIVKNSFSYSQVCRKLGKKPVGAMWELIKSKISIFQIDTSHFLGRSAHAGTRHTGKAKTLTPDEVLTKNKNKRESGKRLTRSLIAIGVPHKCNQCQNEGKWNDQPLVLEVDHIDWDSSNCERANLQFLCPNCHSQRKRLVS